MQQSKFLPTNQPQPQLSPQCDEAWIDGRIAILMSAYRRDDYENPEMFVQQVRMNLQRYPMAIVEFVTDPTTGVQTRCKWPPALAEIVEACEAEYIYQEKLARYNAIPKPKFSQSPELSDRSTRGDGGPGTIYSNLNDEARKKHGRPFGPFDLGRQLPYRS